MLWSLAVLWHWVCLCCVTMEIAWTPQPRDPSAVYAQPGNLRPVARYVLAKKARQTLLCHRPPSMLFHNNIHSSSMFISIIGPMGCRLRFIIWGDIIFPNSSNTCKDAALISNISESLDFCQYLSLYTSAMAYFQSGLVLTMLAINAVCTTPVSWPQTELSRD